MTKTDSKVTIHMVSSLDGYIVKKDGSVAWLQTSNNYDAGVDGDDPEEFLKTIDCYVIGSRTYERALSLGWSYGDKPTIVLTHRDLSADRASIQFRSGDLERLVNEELKAKYKSIWLGGGAAVVKEFLRLRLADEVCMMIAPVIIGDGVLFFDRVGVESPLHLKDVKAYKSGMVELCTKCAEIRERLAVRDRRGFRRNQRRCAPAVRRGTQRRLAACRGDGRRPSGSPPKRNSRTETPPPSRTARVKNTAGAVGFEKALFP